MDDSFFVRVIQGCRNLPHQISDPLQAERCLHELFQRERPLDVTHHDEAVAVVLAVVVHWQYIRVVDAGDGFGLALEPPAKVRPLSVKGRKDLHRHIAVQPRLIRFVDGRHPALSDLLHNVIFAESTTSQTIHTALADKLRF